MIVSEGPNHIFHLLNASVTGKCACILLLYINLYLLPCFGIPIKLYTVYMQYYNIILEEPKKQIGQQDTLRKGKYNKIQHDYIYILFIVTCVLPRWCGMYS